MMSEYLSLIPGSVVRVGSDEEISKWIAALDYSSLWIISDNTVMETTSERLSNIFSMATGIILIPEGEMTKSIETCSMVWDQLLSGGADRQSLILNIGGGVVTDLGGFCASTFQRGVRFINIPTTLLALCDAAVGGKTGVNLGTVKNQIGLFSDPLRVFVMPELTQTLTDRQFKSGLAEAIKHGILDGGEHWRVAMSHPDSYGEKSSELILRSIACKAGVVSRDPKEKGDRRSLNLGHTIGHAIESISQMEEKPMLHGEAVALGLIVTLILSVHLNDYDSAKAEEAILRLYRLLPPYKVIFDKSDAATVADRTLQYIKYDKKRVGDAISFVLMNSRGGVSYSDDLDVSLLAVILENVLETWAIKD